MAYIIEEGKAIVQMDKTGRLITKHEERQGKTVAVPWFIPKEDEENRKQFGVQEITLRKLKVREWAYSLDEFMSIKAGGGIDIKVGAMLIATFPKSIEKAPFELKDNNAVMESVLGLDVILEITNALMELNGLGGKDETKK